MGGVKGNAWITLATRRCQSSRGTGHSGELFLEAYIKAGEAYALSFRAEQAKRADGAVRTELKHHIKCRVQPQREQT